MAAKVLKNLRILKITNKESLDIAEKENRVSQDVDFMPWAIGNSYSEIAEKIITDKNGAWNTPLHLVIGYHIPSIEANELNKISIEYLQKVAESKPLDILSITSHMQGSKLVSKILIRPYSGIVDFTGLFEQLGEKIIDEEKETTATTGQLIKPDDIEHVEYSEEQIKEHERVRKEQDDVFYSSTKEIPFLNRIDRYEPKKLPQPEDYIEAIYDLKTSDMQVSTIAEYEQFTQVFREIMTYVNGIEYYRYINVMLGEETEDSFMNFIESYVVDQYVNKHRLYREDLPIMMEKLHRGLFQFYVLQDLIDDPKVTDIKVTAPNAIRARIYGKAYISNITFIDKADYLRFINGLAIKNKISQNVPSQTFTDDTDENYIIRFSLSAAYANSDPWPYLHIRKIARKKLMS